MKEEGWEKIIPYLNPRLEPHAIDILTAETMNVIWKYMRKIQANNEGTGLRTLRSDDKAYERGSDNIRAE